MVWKRASESLPVTAIHSAVHANDMTKGDLT